MSARVFVPSDSSALSIGADGVAAALAREARARDIELTIVRTGSRGLFWLGAAGRSRDSGRARRLRADRCRGRPRAV